jgi:hypothetical protein
VVGLKFPSHVQIANASGTAVSCSRALRLLIDDDTLLSQGSGRIDCRPDMLLSLSRAILLNKTDRAERRNMSKEAARAEAERLVKEAMERKTVSIKQGKTRIETKCGKCGAPNRVTADSGQVRVEYACKECGHRQRTL